MKMQEKYNSNHDYDGADDDNDCKSDNYTAAAALAAGDDWGTACSTKYLFK